MSKVNVLSIIIFIYGFVFSYFLSPFHSGGDASHYTAAYNAVMNTWNIAEARKAYLTELYSYELIHFLIVWFFSLLGLSKLLLFSLLNGFLYLCAFRLAYIYGKSYEIAFILVITNYYLLALFLTLEKLKIGIIFLILGFLCLKNNNKVWGGVFLGISSISHFQVVVYYIALLFSKMFRKSLYNFYSVLAIVCVLIVFMYMENYIIAKLDWYINLASTDTVYNVFKVSGFGLFVFFLSGMKLRVAAIYLCLSFIAGIIGSDRIFMFAYLYFVLVAFGAGKAGKLAINVSIVYMFYRSCKYIIMVVQTGG